VDVENGGRTAEVCQVLREDPELAETISPQQRERALRECLAAVLNVPGGVWRAESDVPAGGIGLLVLSGFLVRRVGLHGRSGAELLGAGDLLRPWQGLDASPTLPLSTGWQVIEPVRMAVLDETFVLRLGRYPQLSGSLVGRALERSRNLTVNMAIVHQARVEVRLHMLFWHLAARWGRVRSDGVNVPLSLTHSVLADLVAARRPTVTSALAQLSRERLLCSTDDGWLLAGRPPGELLELGAISPQLSDALCDTEHEHDQSQDLPDMRAVGAG
jgi:CRP/FNR family cyclic AMP-dependent transcriptional regulator